jgi:hypothetical protein
MTEKIIPKKKETKERGNQEKISSVSSFFGVSTLFEGKRKPRKPSFLINYSYR